MPAWLLADLIVAIHFAFVSSVVLAVPVILAGRFLGWNWVQNSWFRNIHLAMIGIVVAESLLEIKCPLTTWEKDALSQAGRAGYERSFIGHWLHHLFFFDFEPWVFTIAYVIFGVVVLVLYFAIPPRWLKPNAERGMRNAE